MANVISFILQILKCTSKSTTSNFSACEKIFSQKKSVLNRTVHISMLKNIKTQSENVLHVAPDVHLGINSKQKYIPVLIKVS